MCVYPCFGLWLCNILRCVSVLIVQGLNVIDISSEVIVNRLLLAELFPELCSTLSFFKAMQNLRLEIRIVCVTCESRPCEYKKSPCLLHYNLIAIYNNTTKFSPLQNLMGFLLQFTANEYYYYTPTEDISENTTLGNLHLTWLIFVHLVTYLMHM